MKKYLNFILFFVFALLITLNLNVPNAKAYNAQFDPNVYHYGTFNEFDGAESALILEIDGDPSKLQMFLPVNYDSSIVISSLNASSKLYWDVSSQKWFLMDESSVPFDNQVFHTGFVQSITTNDVVVLVDNGQTYIFSKTNVIGEIIVGSELFFSPTSGKWFLDITDTVSLTDDFVIIINELTFDTVINSYVFSAFHYGIDKNIYFHDNSSLAGYIPIDQWNPFAVGQYYANNISFSELALMIHPDDSNYLETLTYNELEIYASIDGISVGKNYLRDDFPLSSYFVHTTAILNNVSANIGDRILYNPTSGKYEFTYKNPIYSKVPVLDGETVFLTNFDNMITLEDLMLRISAIDEEDGDITHLINVVENQYCPNGVYPTQKGIYNILLSVTDSSDNTATLTVQVHVKDVTAPIITGKKTYSQSYTSKLTIQTVLSALTVTDNHDNNLNIIVKTDNYSSTYNVPGTKTIIFSSTDESENTVEYTVTVNVIDDVVPVFTGPLTILKPQTHILPLTEILDDVNCVDIIDGPIAFTVLSDNFSGNGHKVGTYTVVLKAVDSALNEVTHTITITVKDNVPPVFYVDNFFIKVQDTITLTKQDIIDILVASGQLVINSTTQVAFLTNEYEGNETEQGIYLVSLKSSSADGSSNIFSLAVDVYTLDPVDDVIVNPDNIFLVIWSWCKTPVISGSYFYNGYFVAIGLIVLIIFFAIIFAKRPYIPYRRKYRR